MKNIREFLGKPAVTAVLFALALLLIGSSTVAGAMAALKFKSKDYVAEVDLTNIDVQLVEDQGDGTTENYVVVSGQGGLMGPDSRIAKMIDPSDPNSDGKILANKLYPEVLAVRNPESAACSEYVRVAIYSYWVDENGDKCPEMDSKWIHLGLDTENSGWTKDDTAGSTTEERTILYYSDLLAPGETTPPFLKTVYIDEAATRVVEESETTENNSVLYRWKYVYNGKSFCIEVWVDGVQDHSVDHAKLSAWGLDK